MVVISLNELDQDQIKELEEYSKNLISALDRSDKIKYDNDIAIAKQCAGQYMLGLYHKIDVSKIVGYEPDKMKEIRLALQDGIDVSSFKDLSAEDINKARYDIMVAGIPTDVATEIESSIKESDVSIEKDDIIEEAVVYEDETNIQETDMKENSSNTDDKDGIDNIISEAEISSESKTIDNETVDENSLNDLFSGFEIDGI